MIFEKFIVNMYRKRMQKRFDPDGWTFYYAPSDFEGLSVEEFSFLNNEGDALRAYVYYGERKNTARPLVFDHGLGCGHRAYLRDIAYLVSLGFTVLCYDHTGCATSDGAHIRGLSQSLADLDAFLRYLEGSEEYGAATFRVIGHSWGGYATYNIAAFHSTVTHVVPMSGFRSVRAMLQDQLGGMLRFYVDAVLRAEQEQNPRYADADAAASIKASGVKLFAVHSIDDPVVSYTTHFHSLERELADREDVTFLSYHDRAHNPYNTADAVALLSQFFTMRAARMKKPATEEEKAAFVSSFDFARITEPNADLWADVVAFLNT